MIEGTTTMKKLLVALVVLSLVGTGTALFLTRNTSATHPVLKSADLPSLIPTRAFHADPRSAYNFVLSSDGTKMAYTQASLLGRSILVEDIESGDQIAELPLGLSFLRWHPTKPLLRFIFEGNDWEVDPLNPDRKNWKRTTPVQLSGGWTKNEIAATEDAKILTLGKTCNRCGANLWVVSQDGLEADQIAEGNTKTQYWVLGENHTPVLRVDSLDEKTQRVYRLQDDDWTKLFDLDLNDAFWPVSRVRADNTVLVRSSRGRDKAALAVLDVTTGTETVVIEATDTDIGWATDLTNNGQPDVIRLATNSQDRLALTPEGEVFLDVLRTFLPPVSLGQTSPTGNGRFVVQTLSPQSKSLVTVKIDLHENTHTTLNEFHFRRFADDLVQDEPVTFIARDGLVIPAIMHRPKGVTGPIPFVVYIHGGPAQHTSLGYGHGSQFLANRGYGVLSVNFRGSTGYGKAFQAAGFNEFGRAMQDDIADAALWLVNEGLADTDALVAMGASYGGYAAALAMTRDPGLFDAAIVEFPMLDIEFQSKYHPGFWNNGIGGWWRYFGQTDNDADLALMREYSPVNRVDDLHGPLMIIAGVKDQITAVQQTRDFETIALDAGKDIAVHYFENAGHGVNHWRDELRRSRLLEDFLAKQIGGRSGGFEFVEWAPEFID
jgi:dienelactone hydrolase